MEGTQNYLIPYIEQKLKNLRRPDSDIFLYDSVASLNILTMKNSIEATVFDILSETYSGNSTPEFKGQRNTVRVKYSSVLKGYQSILAIKVTPLEDLVEYQFILYDIVDGGNNIKYRNSSSIFIDPRSSHYQADVNRGLDQVFEKANKRPRVNLTANIDSVDNTYFLTSEDTLLLQPIVDDESAEDDRIFFWTQDSADKVHALIEHSKKNQSLKNLQPGIYNLHFQVSNGINYSTRDTIHLYVYTKPLLKISRPNDKSFFRVFADRLVIQEYVFATRQIDYFSEYGAKLSPAHFSKIPPKLWVKIYDDKGAIYALKSFPFKSTASDTLGFKGGEIVDEDIDKTLTPMKTIKGNKYIISFVARNPEMESREIKNELNVYQRIPISLLYDVMIFPVDKSGLYHSWINAGAGIDLRLNKYLSAIAIVGTDLAQASFKHFYTNLIANFGPIKKFEGGPALLINHDNGNVSTGFKVSYTFYTGSHTNLKIGGSYYNQGNTDYFAVHFTGDIFLNR